eukprot:CAMPEP_0176504702 /NCGR_PEP_ID=MMETSP0200_2-20121128/16084_1 /TAXON_ID=947934 /ORGANISM="Chaetoceros sp., Strain GSL56" /LENGTH=1147 /DNA_ID=CAMNT_0017904171 /DNA_START=49 /DNA_END=3492 /DNA_ORIENTATION=+
MTKNNPFSRFAANTNSKTNNNGWLSTKKRGRDDEQIALDSQKALEDKRKRNQPTTSNRKGLKRPDSSPRPKGRRNKNKVGNKKTVRTNHDDEKEEEEEDSFIASEESEIELEESDDEEEFVIEESHDDEDVDGDEEDYGEDDDNDDELSIDDEEDEDQENYHIKASRARQGGNNVRDAYQMNGRVRNLSHGNPPTAIRKDSRHAMQTINRKKHKVSSQTSVIHLNTSDDDGLSDDQISLENDDDDDSPFSSKAKAKSYILTELDTSCDTVREKDKSKHNENLKQMKSATVSKFFDKKGNGNNCKDLSSPQLFRVKKNTKKPIQSWLDESDDDDDDANAVIKSNVVETLKEPNKKGVDFKKVVSAGGGLSDTDDDGDEEFLEAIALSKAMEESRKQEEKRLMQLSKKSKSLSDNDDFNDDDDGANSEQDNDEDNMDEYVDEKEIEASNVLAAANNLCSRIVSTMASWFEGSTVDIADALIVDGAIALSTVNNKQNVMVENKCSSALKNNHQKWISQEEMNSVCPKISLKDYQLIGVNWLALLHSLTFELPDKNSSLKTTSKKKGGHGRNVNGVLADEMGLGKTAQTIAFLAWLKYGRRAQQNNQDMGIANVDISDDSIDQSYKPHLIVVPASVLENWQREFEKFCPSMNIIKYHGSQAERQEIRNDLREYMPKKKGTIKIGKFQKNLDAVLTTFSYFSSEKSDDRSFLRKFDWNYMVVDEAHCLKNPRGKAYRNLDAFHTDRRLLLTGTPVQNSPKELMSLLCFLMPLFSREASMFDEDGNNDGGAIMLEYFVRLEAIDKKQGNVHISQEEAYARLKQLLAPFVLRRRKDEVLGQWLPPKNRSVEWVPFDEQARLIYDSILAKHLQNSDTSNNTHVFTSLRKAANHILLLRTRHTSPEAIQHLSEMLYMYGYFGRDTTCTLALVQKELEKFSDFDIHCAATALIEENASRNSVLERYLLKEDDIYCSPKFKRLRELLPQLVSKGHRILIFSQWTRCLDLLGCLMDAMNFHFLRLDGQTTISERQQLIDQFTNDTTIPVFLLSTRAGGLGINLTAADTCILHDLDFNPFNDIQAEDRVHRIGQKKTVTIIKMITENTVDADIYKMQERKAEMNAAILESKKSTSSKTNNQGDEETNAILKMAMSRFKNI